MKRYSEKIFFNKSINYPGKIIGIILIIIGLFSLYVNSFFNFNISLAVIFIGFIVLLLINGEKTQKGINNVELVLFIIILILIALIISMNADFDVFIIFIIIGTIGLKEILDKFFNPDLQKRLNILLCILLIIFVSIIAKRIINISNI